MITAVVVDDHPVVVAGVRAWCALADPPITVVDSGPTLATAVVGPGAEADVVVLDLQLDLSGPAYGNLKWLVDAGRRVVVSTMRDDQDTALTCLDIGAVSYLTKAEGESHLVAAIHAAAANQPYTPPALAGALGADTNPNRPRLSEQEINVLREWFHCDSKHNVAGALNIKVSTVNTYLTRVRAKYAAVGRDAPTKAALVARALQDGLVRIDEL
jgi:DNA-binding NarL/FixJ family response regulator